MIFLLVVTFEKFFLKDNGYIVKLVERKEILLTNLFELKCEAYKPFENCKGSNLRELIA